MKVRSILPALMLLSAACAPVQPGVREESRPLLELADVKAMIVRGEVRSVFRPHHGHVEVRLVDGTLRELEAGVVDALILWAESNGNDTNFTYAYE
ncbi:MAG: hypothetical protein KDA57_20935 [Planctomycetales bacterium]|nr:hypothetical protein [Planctomycetales bacterium]